jgi:hypothetical protein
VFQGDAFAMESAVADQLRLPVAHATGVTVFENDDGKFGTELAGVLYAGIRVGAYCVQPGDASTLMVVLATLSRTVSEVINLTKVMVYII